MSQPASYVSTQGQGNGCSSHDTSRAYFHHPDLAAFSEDVNNAAKRAFPNRGRSRYDTVNVCLIRWEEDELGVQHELNTLDYILQCYGFRTNVFLIPKLNSHWSLMRETLDFVQLYDNDRNLFILYYAGHGRMNSARQAEWVFGQSPSSPFVDWSAIQGLFGTAKSDVLILLDTCAAASSATKSQFSVMETIAACGFERRAPAPGEHSMTNTLIEVLRDWVSKPSFSAASLHTEILFRLKLKETRRGRAGIPLEWCVTPIHWVNTKDCKASGIELCRRVPSSSASTTPSGGTQSEAEPSTYVDPMEIDFDDNSSASTPLSSVSSDGRYKVPHVLITLQLEENQPLDARQCARWLDKFPLLAKWAKVEAVYPSYSTLLILSMPIPIWDLLPDHPACSFIGYSTSPKIEILPISKEERAIAVPNLTESAVQAHTGVKMENDSSIEELAVSMYGKRKLVNEDAQDANDDISQVKKKRLVYSELNTPRQKHSDQELERKRFLDSSYTAPKQNLELVRDSRSSLLLSAMYAKEPGPELQVAFNKVMRDGRSKVKTGCANCKSRRIKCDATRPECVRCVRSGRVCTGYQKYKKLPQVTPNKPQPINAFAVVNQTVRVNHRGSPPSFPLSISLGSPTIYQPEGFRFSDQESRYISIFQKYTISEVAGLFDSEFWAQSVLELTVSQASIRHTVVAVGALYKTLEGTPEASPRSTVSTSLNLAASHYAFALQQYSKAIVKLRMDLEKEETRSTRVVLMSIVLFVCFQSFTGDVKSASMHISHGLRILEEYRQSSPRSLDKDDIVEERLIQVFTRLAVQAKSCDMAFNFPKPYGIRFSHRDPSYSLPITFPSPLLNVSLSATNQDNSYEFTTFQEARQALDTLWARTMRFSLGLPFYSVGNAKTRDSAVQSSALVIKLQLEQWGIAFNSLYETRYRSGISILELVGANMLKMTHLTIFILSMMEFSSSEREFDNFTPHFRDVICLAREVVSTQRLPPAQQQTGDPDPATSVGLVNEYTNSLDRHKTTMDTPTKNQVRSSSVEEWKQMKPKIRDLIVNQRQKLKEIRRIVNEDLGFAVSNRQLKVRIKKWGFDTKNVKGDAAHFPRNTQEHIDEIKASFSADLGIVFPLFTVATKCRDRSLRRTAVQLLLSRPRREGMWDSILSGRVAQLIIEIEEEGLTPWGGPGNAAAGEQVLKEKFVTIKEILFDLQRREAKISYSTKALMKNENDAGPTERTRHIRW